MLSPPRAFSRLPNGVSHLPLSVRRSMSAYCARAHHVRCRGWRIERITGLKMRCLCPHHARSFGERC